MDGTKAAGTGADVAQDHERRGLLAVALHSIGALRVVANRLEPQLVQQPLGQVIGVAARDWSSKPAGESPGTADLRVLRNLGFGDDGQTKCHGLRAIPEKQ